MNEKYLKLTKQFNKTVSQLCAAPAEFNRFLRVAAFNYRLTFQNAVLAYAQDTGSDLLLTYEQWQSYRRVPKLHTKATLLFDVNHRGRYVVTFPMSRTVVDKRVHRYRELRLFDYRNDAAVVEALKAVFQTDADNLTEILYAENLKRFESFFDDAYPAFDNETDFLAKAVTNMLMCRFGEEMPYKNFSFSGGINRDNIEHIYQMVIDVFRAEFAEISTALPAELEKAREHKEENDLPFDAKGKKDVISLFKEKTNELFHSIDGLSPSEIEQIVREYAENIFAENEISAEIVEIAVSGSRCRALEHNGSDLDVVIEVQSDTKETALFNLLNEHAFEIGGVRVDINPIKADETGTLSEYLPTVEKYLNQIEILDYGKYSRSVYKGRKNVKVNQKTIASLCGLKTTATVSKAINKLLLLGYIERIDRYYDDYKKLGSFVYTIPVIRGRAYFFVNRRFFKYHLTAAQTRMYLYCCKCADSRSKRFWNSYNDICSTLHLKRSAVVQTLKELVCIGLIKKYRVRKKDGSYSDNHYKVVALKPPRIRRKGKRRSRFALGFSQSNICVKQFYNYILKHNHKNVNTLRIYFFDLRGSPKIFSSLLVPTFNTNRERKRLQLYLEYSCNLGQDFLKKQKQLRLARIRAKPPPS